MVIEYEKNSLNCVMSDDFDRKVCNEFGWKLLNLIT